MKNGLLKQPGKDLALKLQFLLTYRSTPCDTTGVSPLPPMFKRPIRTCFNLLWPRTAGARCRDPFSFTDDKWQFFFIPRNKRIEMSFRKINANNNNINQFFLRQWHLPWFFRFFFRVCTRNIMGNQLYFFSTFILIRIVSSMWIISILRFRCVIKRVQRNHIHY